jgi:hypothetical protein
VFLFCQIGNQAIKRLNCKIAANGFPVYLKHLRVEIRRIMMTTLQPHDSIHARLGPSAIHGIGVFAIHAIGAGTNVFENDRRAINWIDSNLLEHQSMTHAQRKLYDDFGVRKGALLGCPENFNLLTVGWYVNEPLAGELPNLIATELLDMLAVRDIALGEELTIAYDSFSDLIPTG